MPFWRREEPLHERLAREGGLTPRQPRLPWREVGIHGIARPREWDAVVTADAGELRGDEVVFVALPDGTLLVEEGDAEGDLNPLAAAVESALTAPYRARGVRRGESTWAVGGNRIDVIELEGDPGGDEVELAVTGEGHTLLVDGERAFGHVRELHALGAGDFDAFVVRAARLDGNLWEASVEPL